MGNPAALHAAVVARLDTITTVTVYDADVPAAPPAELATGRVYPYAVVWPTAGWTPDEARALNGDTEGGLLWPFQVTVAAGDPGWCLEATHLVRTALEGHVLVSGAGPLREDEGAPGMQPDRDASPVRWFVPLLFRCLTA